MSGNKQIKKKMDRDERRARGLDDPEKPLVDPNDPEVRKVAHARSVASLVAVFACTHAVAALVDV